MKIQEFNIASNSENEIEAGLSNLSYNPFNLNGIVYASIEAFWQSLKFEEGTDDWNKCIKLSGIESKKFGNNAIKNSTFSYNGEQYIVGSKEHQNLMKLALKEQFKQNPDKLNLLLSTGKSNLIHKPKREDGSYYPDSTTIPGEIFSLFLMELRDEFNVVENFVETTTNTIGNTLNKLNILLNEISSVFRDHVGEPLDISYYRENSYPEINDYLLDIFKKLYSLYEEMGLNQRGYFSSSLENYITFDDESKSYLYNQLNNRLVENLGDLYYNTLADFLEELYKITGNEKLKIASEKIKIAWNISEPYVDKNNPPKKHENAEFEIELSGGIVSIANKFRNSAPIELGEFLLKLSDKISIDGEKDSNRPSVGKDGVVNETKKRTKLATALIEASLILKEVGNSLIK